MLLKNLSGSYPYKIGEGYKNQKKGRCWIWKKFKPLSMSSNPEVEFIFHMADKLLGLIIYLAVSSSSSWNLFMKWLSSFIHWASLKTNTQNFGQREKAQFSFKVDERGHGENLSLTSTVTLNLVSCDLVSWQENNDDLCSSSFPSSTMFELLLASAWREEKECAGEVPENDCRWREEKQVSQGKKLKLSLWYTACKFGKWNNIK